MGKSEYENPGLSAPIGASMNSNRSDEEKRWQELSEFLRKQTSILEDILHEISYNPLGEENKESVLITAAVFGFRCAEKGMNIHAMLDSLKERISSEPCNAFSGNSYCQLPKGHKDSHRSFDRNGALLESWEINVEHPPENPPTKFTVCKVGGFNCAEINAETAEDAARIYCGKFTDTSEDWSVDLDVVDHYSGSRWIFSLAADEVKQWEIRESKTH